MTLPKVIEKRWWWIVAVCVLAGTLLHLTGYNYGFSYIEEGDEGRLHPVRQVELLVRVRPLLLGAARPGRGGVDGAPVRSDTAGQWLCSTSADLSAATT